jgi:glycosyl transferase family 25
MPLKFCKFHVLYGEQSNFMPFITVLESRYFLSRILDKQIRHVIELYGNEVCLSKTWGILCNFASILIVTDMGKEKELGIDHIYVVHAPKGYEQHEKRLYRILERKYGFDFEFLDKDNEDLIQSYFVENISQIMNRGAVMCSLNHIMFYETIVRREDKIALVLEDDPYFSKHFLKHLRQIAVEAQTLQPGFFISLENSTLKFPHRKVIKKGKFLYEASCGRCAGAYLIDNTAAKNIIDRLKQYKCDKVIDHWHNDLIDKNIFKMYWAHPACVEQGSINGKMSAGNSTQHAGIIRRISWIAQKIYKTHILSFFR